MAAHATLLALHAALGATLFDGPAQGLALKLVEPTVAVDVEALEDALATFGAFAGFAALLAFLALLALGAFATLAAFRPLTALLLAALGAHLLGGGTESGALGLVEAAVAVGVETLEDALAPLGALAAAVAVALLLGRDPLLLVLLALEALTARAVGLGSE